MKALKFYQNQVELAKETIQKGRKEVRLLGLTRLFVFLFFSTLLFLFWGNSWLIGAILIAGLTIFLLLVSKSVDARTHLEKAKKMKELNEFEILAIHGNWSAFDAGAEFANSSHSFSNDLDLFTPKGVFSFLNRTVSLAGKNALAKLILNGTQNQEQNNQLIEALATDIGWTQDFRVSGSLSSREKGFNQSFQQWFELEIVNPSWMKWMIFGIPLLTIPSLFLYNFDLISSSLFGLIITFSMIITGSLVKTTNQIAAKISEFSSKATIMQEQIQAINSLKIEQEEIVKFQQELSQIELNAAIALKEFLVIHKRFELRMNLLVGIPLNIFVAWDLIQRNALAKWNKKYQNAFISWEEMLTNMEVLISGATMKFNHPETVFVQFSDTKSIEIKELKHPLLSNNKVVSNDLSMSEMNQIMILTGPNMAGKSTFLRALGLIFVFGNAGLPVFAKQVSIPKVTLYSSMRTSDDLSNESSYFHAELTRLKLIMDALNQQQDVFILLDEILKGTNSKDKEEGSKKFLQKLQANGAKGIIATHDLTLCELAIGNPIFTNACFDSTITEENLFFDYKLKSGICQNMNASFLLKKMNLVD